MDFHECEDMPTMAYIINRNNVEMELSLCVDGLWDEATHNTEPISLWSTVAVKYCPFCGTQLEVEE